MSTIVETLDGKLRGTTGINLDGKTFLQFFGIRYAKPPVGDLRFKPPQPIEPWDGVVEATQVGNRSISRDDICFELGGSEDCLFLNVYCWTLPSPTSKLRPVMVYIHGGGFVFGCNRPGLYGPEYLMTKDVVVVTINYRLGILGFLSVDGTEVTGNMGLKDQNLALRWVQRNIRSFGGDPHNVTIFGESAGSAAVHAHVLSPASKGLFHKAILQSGTALNSWFYGSKNNAIDIVSKLDQHANSNKEALDILMKTDAFHIFEAQEKFSDISSLSELRPFGPVIEIPNETAFLTEDPRDIIKKGSYNKVAMIISYTNAEGLLQHYLDAFKKKEQSPMSLDSAIPYEIHVRLGSEDRKKVVDILQQLYADLPNDQYDLLTDAFFLASIIETTIGHLKTSTEPVYLLRMSILTELNYFRNIIKRQGRSLTHPGACHADDLGYLWRSEVTPEFIPGSAEDRYVRIFVELWTNFAELGNPNSDKLGIYWKPVESKDKLQVLEIGEEIGMKDIPEKKRIDTWLNIYKTWQPIKRSN